MIGDTVSAAALCIVGAAVAILLKQYCREQAMFSSIAVCVMVLAAALAFASPVIEQLESLFEKTSLDKAYFKSLLKAVGICYMTGITADICRDSGEQSLASAAEIWGRMALLTLTLPMIDSLLGIITGVFQ
ncbi:MAG: stage III sporulation AC/AD family protein [Ruminococcus sp.]|nr:stage III sporulation AC/AD family protein [Ruminococcus sp.]